VLRALGELHLRSVLERMGASSRSRSTRARRGFRIARRSLPKPRAFHRHKKQTGGAGQFGEVSLRVEPRERGAGFEFVDATKGGVIPHQFMPAVQKGVEQVLVTGAIAGFPLQDVRVIVYDGKHHPVDSKEVAFVSAGKKAFLDAVAKAKPIVLEPIVSVEVICPDVNTGDIAGDLSSRRGQVTGTKECRRGYLPSAVSRRSWSLMVTRRG
jgi:elongation factor G